MTAIYGAAYRRKRAELIGRPCALRLVCDGAPADSADHVPPLSLHVHIPGSECCCLQPACRRCQHVQGHQLAKRSKRRRALRRVPYSSRVW